MGKCIAALIATMLIVCACTAQETQQMVSDQQLGIRKANGQRDVPFYAFYCWASDLHEKPGRFKLLADTGIKMIGSPLREEQEPGILQCATRDIQVAGILGFNSYGRTMDLDGFRKYVHAAVRRYGPEGSLWKENPKVPAMPGPISRGVSRASASSESCGVAGAFVIPPSLVTLATSAAAAA